MTTSNSSSSDKKVYVQWISSEVYLTVSPERRDILEHIVNSNNNKLPLGSYSGNQVFRYSCGTSYGMHRAFAEEMRAKIDEKHGRKYPAIYIPAYTAIRISYSEVLDLLNRANELALETEEGIKSAINRIIDTDTKGGMQPGTLRFFSNDLICYYTGKSWKKIERLP